jgi:uncharacterized protein with NRDE domain
MCLIVVAWRARPDLPLVVAANRDEWRRRPAEPARWWESPAILAGRDLEAGGTWMGITREGRFAAVTNFRDPSDKRPTARSRGALVTEFLSSDATPTAFAQSLIPHVRDYNGFNLILGDGESLAYFGSREGEAREIAPGVHGLSNHLLDEPWPKVTRGREAMEAALADADPAPRLFKLLSDTAGAPDEILPRTGVGIEWERRLASPLITGEDYGTRASTVVTVSNGGRRFLRGADQNRDWRGLWKRYRALHTALVGTRALAKTEQGGARRNKLKQARRYPITPLKMDRANLIDAGQFARRIHPSCSAEQAVTFAPASVCLFVLLPVPL